MTTSPTCPSFPGAVPSRLPSGSPWAHMWSALAFSTTATALAAAGYHLALGGTAPAAAVAAVACFLFGGSLLRSHEPRRLARDVVHMVLAQVSACCWFAWTGAEAGGAGTAVHGEAGAVVYAATALIMVVALRTALFRHPRLPVRVPEAVRVVAQYLHALTSAYTTSEPATTTVAPHAVHPREDEHSVPTFLPTGLVGRRGPPWIAAPYVSAPSQRPPATRRNHDHLHRRSAPA
ncbi:hypothetical protein ACFQ8O_25905 [Streptomyces coelicoflavus]|uniref:hypothetical protein n=1 Tax=Streptomyces coelicoflavus TaxID=285562 RepID=UPI003675FC6A